MRRNAVLLIITVLINSCIAGANAESYEVTGSFEEEHTLSYTQLWNQYKITAQSGKQIEYSFEAKGNGSIMVLFVKGHDVDHNSDYLLLYSRDTPVRSYSDEFKVNSDDGTQFTLIIMTQEDTNVTYTANIKVVDAPLTDFICGAMILFVLIGCGGVAAILIRTKRKQLEGLEGQKQTSGHEDKD